MSMFLRISAASVLCTIGAIAVSQAQSVTCENAQYDPSVLAKYPNLAKACLDIVTKEGEPYAVVKAKLDRVSGNNASVRVKLPDGTYHKRQTVRTDPDLRVLIEGKPTRVRDLATGQELTVYVKVREPVMALAPAEETTPLAAAPIQDEEPEQEQMAATLPATSSFLPLLGLFGGVSLLLGGLLSAIRYRRR
jgi:hypothetical protein